MTTFLFGAVATSGMAIIGRVPFRRRNRFVLTAAFAVGFGATLVPTWFSYVFTYQGDNDALMGFFNAIELIRETGYALTAFVALLLNLALPDELDDDHMVECHGEGELDEVRHERKGSRVALQKELGDATPSTEAM